MLLLQQQQQPPTKTSDVLGAENVLRVHTWMKHQLRPMPIRFDANGSDKVERQHLRVFPWLKHPPTTSYGRRIAMNCDANAAVVAAAVHLATTLFDSIVSCDYSPSDRVHLKWALMMVNGSWSCYGSMYPMYPTLKRFAFHNALLVAMVQFSV